MDKGIARSEGRGRKQHRAAYDSRPETLPAVLRPTSAEERQRQESEFQAGNPGQNYRRGRKCFCAFLRACSRQAGCSSWPRLIGTAVDGELASPKSVRHPTAERGKSFHEIPTRPSPQQHNDSVSLTSHGGLRELGRTPGTQEPATISTGLDAVAPEGRTGYRRSPQGKTSGLSATSRRRGAIKPRAQTRGE